MTSTIPTNITGIVLAAGAGTRMGTPKALLATPDGEPWLARATALLLSAGCDPVVVVLGARADRARPLVPADAAVTTVIAERWADGMAESLRAGLAAAEGDAALITLVDLPDLPVAVARRVLRAKVDALSLRQAVFGGRPGHPVLIGRGHWVNVSTHLSGRLQLPGHLSGDKGARDYLVAHGVEEIECGDLFDGHDVDRPV
ncbi:MAG: nucleotidyltransferase family protein [Lacisediminihabitans sp.]